MAHTKEKKKKMFRDKGVRTKIWSTMEVVFTHTVTKWGQCLLLYILLYGIQGCLQWSTVYTIHRCVGAGQKVTLFTDICERVLEHRVALSLPASPCHTKTYMRACHTLQPFHGNLIFLWYLTADCERNHRRWNGGNPLWILDHWVTYCRCPSIYVLLVKNYIAK